MLAIAGAKTQTSTGACPASTRIVWVAVVSDITPRSLPDSLLTETAPFVSITVSSLFGCTTGI